MPFRPTLKSQAVEAEHPDAVGQAECVGHHPGPPGRVGVADRVIPLDPVLPFAEGPVEGLEEPGVDNRIGVDEHVGVVAGIGAAFGDLGEEILERVPLAPEVGVVPLDDQGAGLSRFEGGGVGAVVGDDVDRERPGS